MTPRSVKTEALLEHAGWMRNLALSLVGDAQQAEDLTQETWLKALERPPREEGPMRGWLTTVMMNLLRQEKRGNLRRFDRELQSAIKDEDPGDSGAALLARVSMQRELVELVLTLDEPYRKVVLLRYFEELSPKRIAAQERIPVSTVKTRLARGIERLRRQLDTQHGSDGRSWALALLPVLKKPAGLAPSLSLPLVPIGALVVNSKVTLTAIALSVLGAGYMLSRPAPVVVQADEVAEVLPGSTNVDADDPQGRPATANLGQSVAPSEREQLAAAAPTLTDRSSGVEAVPEQARLKGRVVNMSGQPVGGIEIVAMSGMDERRGAAAAEALAVSAGDGTFTASRVGVSRLVVRDPRFTTVMAGVPVDVSASREAIVVIAPKLQWAGTVVDESGSPVESARIDYEAPKTMRGDARWVLDYSHEIDFSAESGPDGSFEIVDAPRAFDGVLRVTSKGYSATLLEAPIAHSSNLLVVLARPRASNHLLTGLVIDRSGTPVPDAQVSLGIDTTNTDEHGTFSFDLQDPESFNGMFAGFVGGFRANELLAMKEGFLPGRLKASGEDAKGRPDWPHHVVLRIGGEPLEITGRVLDGSGEALANTLVWIENPTLFGGRREEGRSFPRLTHVESTLANLDPGWPTVETDANGRFKLRGLMDRAYTIEAMDPDTLVRTQAVAVQAGTTGVDIVISREQTWDVLRGRVVDGKGNPVGNARVRVSCDAFRTRIQGTVVGTRHASGAQATTDGQGRFELEVVPKENAYFRIDHPDTIPIELGRSEQTVRNLVGEDYEDFTLVVSRRCHFKIELASADEADQFEIHDAEDAVLGLSEFQGNGRRDGPRFPIVNGRTNLLAVGDTATTLVLFLGGEEVKRVPVDLQPGEQALLRP